MFILLQRVSSCAAIPPINQHYPEMANDRVTLTRFALTTKAMITDATSNKAAGLYSPL